jgi:hypothetical protein
MGEEWKANLASCFEEIRIIQISKKETVGNFNQFCEFIAEPAFETLEEEFKEYGVKTKIEKSPGKSIAFRINFPKSRADNFYYIIFLPKNSLELVVKLKIKGRKDKWSPTQEKQVPFLDDPQPKDVFKINKSDLIQDVIEHYRYFSFEALTHKD